MNQNDFDRTYERIQQTINDAADNLQRIIDNPLWSSIYGNQPNPIKKNASGSANVAAREGADQDGQRSTGSTGSSGGQNTAPKPRPRLFESMTRKKAGGIIALISGLFLTLVGSIRVVAAIVALATASMSAFAFSFAFAWAILLLAAGLFLAFNGGNLLSRIKRFRRYVEALGKKSYIDLDDLSEKTGKSKRALKKDLKDMIKRQYFLQGHLDEEEENLIVSNETYQDYLKLQEQMKLEQQEADQLSKDGFDEEGRAIISQGEFYLNKIKEANDNLPGEVISAKLYELENVINRILEEVRKQPESAGELRKLMNYYLPTTWKLLDAYQEVENQPVKTQQMIETQKEIEDTLDTINDAFKRLLDQLFMKKAWDISTDISALNSMLVQEGLKDGEYALKQ